MKKEVIYTCILVMLLFSFKIGHCQFEQQLPAKEVLKYQAELKRAPLKDLEAILNSEISYYNKSFVLNELLNRKGGKSIDLITDFINKLESKTKGTTGPNFTEKMLRADAIICKVKLISKDEEQYVKELDKLITQGDSYVIDVCAVELGSIGTIRARDILLKYENISKPLIKVNRLKIECWNKPTEEFVECILNSAKKVLFSIKESNLPPLVAERTILTERGAKESLQGIISRKINEELKSSNNNQSNQNYITFLREIQTHTIYLDELYRNSKKSIPQSSIAETKFQDTMKTISFEPNNNGYNLESIKEMDSIVRQSTQNLIILFNSSNSRINLQKIAKELGDRWISGKLILNESEKIIIEKVVDNYFIMAKSEDGDERAEAKLQIERLWKISVPSLFKYIDDDDPIKLELASKSLILMRDESIINAIIEKAKRTTIYDKRMRYIFILSKMNEQRKSIVPNRNCLSPEQSEELYNRLVIPAIKELKDF